MLRSLDVRDMLLIDSLSLDWGEGLNVLTGETGAGKSILLDSLGFVLGWRGRAELVRTGAERGEVTAIFHLPADHPARAVLEEAGIDVEDGEVILRRVNSSDGRKTAWINGARVPGGVLRDLSDTLVELHGQHDDRGLLNPRGHRDLLDAFAGAEPMVAATREAWRARGRAEKALTAAEAGIAAIREEEEFLRHAVGELDKLDPQPGEDEALDARRRLMQAAERLREDVARAGEAIGLQGAEGAASDAMRWLSGVADRAEGRLDPPIEALERALEALDEAGRGVADALDALTFNPSELEEVEERLFAIRGLARKHGVAPDDLGGFADGLRARLAELDAGEGHLSALRSEVKAARGAYDDAAGRLTALRQDAAERLDSAMVAELGPLKMERAVFRTEVEPADPGPDGTDAVQFTVSTNPGAPPGPLARIASGGELSRFLLALKVVLTKDAGGLTLIFDEIDRGVGGATADAVGRRLKRLSETAQVLVVTHSPQVAALADRHWQVRKEVTGDVTTSLVTPLEAEARVDEVARMISGADVTPAAREAARALLAG